MLLMKSHRLIDSINSFLSLSLQHCRCVSDTPLQNHGGAHDLLGKTELLYPEAKLFGIAPCITPSSGSASKSLTDCIELPTSD